MIDIYIMTNEGMSIVYADVTKLEAMIEEEGNRIAEGKY